MPRTVGNPLALAVNLFAIASSVYSLHYITHFVHLPPHLVGAGQWQFLTNISLVVSQFVFIMGAAAHLLSSKSLFLLKNNIHPIALTMECIVTGIYWPLKLMFIHHLVKDPTAKLLPLSVDLCLHFFPVLALAIDYFFFMPKWTIAPGVSFGACLVMSSMYWLWLKVAIDFNNGGEYPYMFLNVPDEQTRALIFGAVGLLAFASFMALRALHGLIVCDAVESKKVKVQ